MRRRVRVVAIGYAYGDLRSALSILTMCPCCAGLGREAEDLIEDLLS